MNIKPQVTANCTCTKYCCGYFNVDRSLANSNLNHGSFTAPTFQEVCAAAGGEIKNGQCVVDHKCPACDGKGGFKQPIMGAPGAWPGYGWHKCRACSSVGTVRSNMTASDPTTSDSRTESSVTNELLNAQDVAAMKLEKSYVVNVETTPTTSPNGCTCGGNWVNVADADGSMLGLPGEGSVIAPYSDSVTRTRTYTYKYNFSSVILDGVFIPSINKTLSLKKDADSTYTGDHVVKSSKCKEQRSVNPNTWYCDHCGLAEEPPAPPAQYRNKLCVVGDEPNIIGSMGCIEIY